MKQNMKRLAALALALSMCLSLLFNNAWTAEVSGYTEDDFVAEPTTDIDSSDAESEEYGEVPEVEADAAEEAGTDNIPDDALSYNGHYYYFYDEACTWWDAKEYCESVGGYLVTITTEDEQNAVYCYVEELAGDEDIWIGITDSGTEGDWSTWITGETVTYTKWGENEPDDFAGGQDYGVICTGYRDGGSIYYVEPGQWDDVGDTENHFLCEWGDLDDSGGSEDGDTDSEETSTPDSEITPTMTITVPSTISSCTAVITCTVTIDKADTEYLTDFMENLTCTFNGEAAMVSDSVATEIFFPAMEVSSSYKVAADGLSATCTLVLSRMSYTAAYSGSGTVTFTVASGQTVESGKFYISLTVTGLCCSELSSPMFFTYSDDWFAESSYSYNHALARTSLCLEMTSFTSDTSAWGESGEGDSTLAMSRYQNIADAYETLGFTETEYHNYGKALDDTDDLVAYSFASKVLDADTTLVAVVIRGGGYGAEWSSNFNVGSGEDYHEGFYNAACDVYENLETFLSGIDGNVKLWITGYSRGAAVGNLLTAKVDDAAENSNQYSAEDVYAYLFATPQGVTMSQTMSENSYGNLSVYDALYNNIYNIVNPGDVVPAVALTSWGFTRYGVTKYFNLNASDTVYDSIGEAYYAYTGDTVDAKENVNQVALVSALTDVLSMNLSSPDEAASLLEVVQEFLEFTNTQKQNDEGEWEAITVEDFLETLSLRYGARNLDAATAKVEKYLSVEFGSLETPYQPDVLKYVILSLCEQYDISDDVLKIILILCELHDISCAEAVNLVSDLLLNDVWAQYIFLPKYSSTKLTDIDIATSHQPGLYLAWMDQEEEEAFCESQRGTVVLSIACPVDVTICDGDGNAVAVITDHEFVLGDVPVIINEDTVKIYLPANSQYSVEITATDSGIMNYSVTELDMFQNTIIRVNYYDVELVEGRIFTAEADASTEYEEGKYNLTYHEDGTAVEIQPDEILTEDVEVTLTVEVIGEGMATRSGIYRIGDTVVLKAEADENYRFAGWYMVGELISEQEIANICIKEDTEIICLFTVSDNEEESNTVVTEDNEETSTAALADDNEESTMPVSADDDEKETVTTDENRNEATDLVESSTDETAVSTSDVQTFGYSILFVVAACVLLIAKKEYV